MERYESDVEEDSVNMSAGHYGNSLSNNIDEELLIVVSERFIEEKNSQGKVTVCVSVCVCVCVCVQCCTSSIM